jgi:hypothetical protein
LQEGLVAAMRQIRLLFGATWAVFCSFFASECWLCFNTKKENDMPDLGKIAYEEYIRSIQAISTTPIQVIKWTDLSADYRAAWDKVASAVISAVR